MKEIIEAYHKYVQTFHQEDDRIPYKFEHSLRVMDKMTQLSTGLNQTPEEQWLSSMIGLFHDYGRFYQVENFKTYQDIIFDHGNYGAEELITKHHIHDFIKEPIDERVIYDAIKNHNKYQIEEGLSQKSILFSKMIRDADKLDILEGIAKGYIKIHDNQKEITPEVKNEFYQCQSIHSKNIQNENDRIIAFLGYLYDFNFSWSLDYLKEYQVLEQIEERLQNQMIFQPYFTYISNYIDKKREGAKEYVRKKI